MKIDKSLILIAVFSFVSWEIFCYQNNQIKVLKEFVEINKKSQEINEDEIRDLICAVQEEKNKNEGIATRNYVAGILDGVNKKDYYAEIWHKGFDSGIQNKILIGESEKAYVVNKGE